MTERTEITTLIGLAVTFREPKVSKADEREAWQRGDILIVRKDNGAIVATVSRDDLFDRHGNRFTD